MDWNFASADGRIRLSLKQGNAQSFGDITIAGSKTVITGGNLIGSPGDVQISGGGLSNAKLAVSGDHEAPTSLRLTGSEGPSQIDETLLPMMNRNIGDIVDAYRRAYAVLTIAEDNGVLRCTQAWHGGPTLQARGGTIGLSRHLGFDYEDPRNLTYPDDMLGRFCDGPAGASAVTLKLPKLNTEGGTPGPVIIQFLGDSDHFADPPFAEAHDHVTGVYYEEYKRQCLSIEFSNSGGSQTLNFNHGHKRGHKSVIIEPNAF